MKKRGSSVVTMPVVFTITIIFTMMFIVVIVKLIIPFIIYQKIDNIATKYMYIVEKFGYLTLDEKNNLINELREQGLNTNYATIQSPTKKEPYGNLLTLKISYNYKIDFPTLQSGKIQNSKKETVISVEKNSFSKIY